MLSYILFDKTLFENLRAETRPAFQNGHINLPYLMENCPRLESTYQETLRVVSGALSARKIIAPTRVGGKTLRSGNTIIIPFQQLHYDRSVFGNDPSQFISDRFLKDPNLLKSPNFKPFGGGHNFCPGRFLARQEMLVFVTLVLNRFDIELATTYSADGAVAPQRFPKLDESTPALGVNGPVKGHDVFVNIKVCA